MKKGWLEVIAGSMYSGKTEELIKRLRRAQYARQKIQVFKPSIDQRYHETHVASHDQNLLEAIPLRKISDVWNLIQPGTQVIGFDEGQFLSDELVAVCQQLVAQGYRVIVAGLDMDWQGKPFEPMPTLMAIAEEVHKPRAICTVCGELASYTQKLKGSTSQVEVGSTENYQARCRHHFQPKVELENVVTGMSVEIL